MTIPFLDMRAMNEEVRDDLDRVWTDAVDGSGFIGGRHVEEFEASWAAYCGTRHAVGVANGTDAIELTLAALGIGEGDEVIVPANTFVATVSAVARVGAQPVFVDVDPATLLMTGAAALAAVTPRTAAVIPVHLYGQPVDMGSIRSVADRAGLAVIEDAAQAHGARWDGIRVGGLGDAACFSFYPGKNLGALGDGGAVVTDDTALATRIRQLANHGRGSDRHVHDVIGRNSRLDAIQAGFLHVKLGRLDAWNEARRIAAAAYDELLAPHVELTDQRHEAESVYHLYVIRTEGRDALQAALGAQGIASGLHYPIPCHQLPPYMDAARPVLPVAEDAARRILSLPMSPHMGGEQIERVAGAVREHVQGQRAIA